MPEMLEEKYEKLQNDKILRINTYKNPTKNLVTIKTQTWVENDEMTENANAIDVQKCITFFLPPCSQSAKNPQKNEVVTIPGNLIFGENYE